MIKKVEEKLDKIPVLNWIVRLLQKIKLPGLEGLSLYDLLEMYIIGIGKGALSSRAGAIAFSLFMALFPFLLFILNLIPYVPVDDFDTQFLAFIESLFPSTEAEEFFSQIYIDIDKHRRGGLLSSAFMVSIFLIANGVNAIFSGFENSYHVELTRNFVRQYIYALFIGLILALLLILGAVGFIYFELYVIQYVSDFADKTAGVSYLEGDEVGVIIGKFLFFAILTYLFTAILYFFGTQEGRKARFFSPGALLTTVLIIITTYLFGIYVERFARYNELYGAIGGLLILMVYIWLNANILLLGFELNASLTRLRRKKLNIFNDKNDNQN